MGFSFSDADIDRMAQVLHAPAQREGSVVRFKLHDASSGRRITLEIARNLALPADVSDEQPGNLVSVMAASSFLQLQGCTGFIASEELGEVIFFARRAGVTNGLVVEREAGCSLFANCDQRLLSTDFMQLAPELIMSTVALSMTETLFNDLG
jgi:hypothetical protein